ncbi:MAG TPA: cytochrome ubiquinol oxidase subunit I [Gemmatimonadaceae bacterium]|nr:cytochrome ubiquinol oxidase subunit I [Gemmatimonadaceae bacterium]
MHDLDQLVLARLQFAFTVSFHIIFPTISIGLALFLAIVEGLWLRTGDLVYRQIYRFWLNIFAMSFGIGVVTGVVMSFQFGLAFAKFAQVAGPVIGPLIGLEALTAFFLEAGFLGIMLFGESRVGPKLHIFATCMVALGTVISASWIMSANSWMQTPDGVAWGNGRLLVTDWRRVVVNPSWPVRLPHMLLAAYLTAAFFVSGVSAWYLLRQREIVFAQRTLSLGMGAACILIALQVFVGDRVGGVLVKYQPAKLQAAEGWWDKTTPSPTPYLWIIVPDQAGQRNRFQMGTSYMGSIWLTKSLKGTVGGLRNTPADRQPRMVLVFYSFKLMLALGMTMFTLAVISLWLRWHGRLYSARWFLRTLVVMTPSGVVATLGGWYTAEIGRQPYVITGMMRTAEAVSPVPAGTLLGSLIAFACAYAVFFLAFLVFTLRIIRRGPAGLPAHALPSGSLKRDLRPEIAGVQPYLSGAE